MNKKIILLLALLIFGAIITSACEPVTPVPDESVSAADTNAGQGYGPGAEDGECDGSGQHQGEGGGQHGQGGQHGETGAYPNYAVSELSDVEKEGLAFMREEEKLARDVYLTLFETWDLRTFSNIASSEQTHTDSVKFLLDKYELPDPVADDSIGVFVNDDLQALYDELVEKGNTSLVDALTVGAAIEEIDILDLIDYLGKTDDPNLEWVYENLKSGSENHLRAFASQYEMQTGEAYQPQFLSQEQYDAIINASNGQGGGHGRGGNGNGQGNGHGQNNG